MAVGGRTAAVVVVAAVGVLATWAALRRGDSGPAPAGTEDDALDVRADPRIALLLADCQAPPAYDVETGDVTAVLIETLGTGTHDALKRAKPELAADPRAFARVARLFARWVDDPHGLSRTMNAIDVATLSDAPEARDLLLRALGHASETVRTAALRGLAKHGRAEDFDRVLERAVRGGTEGDVAVATLPELDRGRAEVTFARWISEGTTARWDVLARVVAAGTAPELVAVCRGLRAEPAVWAAVDIGQRPYLLAPLLRAGDAAAGAELDAFLADPDPALRRFAVDALRAAEEWERVARAFAADGDAGVRALAASALVEGPGALAAPDAFRRALDDADETLRGLALHALVEAGDATARDRAVAMLSQDPRARQAALGALAPSMEREPELAARVHDALRAVWEPFSERPVQDGHEILAAIARVPDPRSVELVLGLAERARGELEPGVDAHRWLVRQAANGGPSAHAALDRRLAAERDPRRRLDLLEALAGRGGDPARQRLLALVSDESSDPWEVLFAASRLVHLGPAERVLPLLKRVALRVEEDEVRGALWCLLWRWYPRPR